jgi:hypothetical protein
MRASNFGYYVSILMKGSHDLLSKGKIKKAANSRLFLLLYEESEHLCFSVLLVEFLFYSVSCTSCE